MVQGEQGAKQATLSQQWTRQKMRVALFGLLVLITGLGLGALAAWAHFYWLAGASVAVGMGIARIIAVWNI